MSFISDLLLLATAVGIGVMSAVTGMGGGFAMVPLLVLAYGVETHLAVGTSLMAIIPKALSISMEYLRQKRVDMKVGLLTAVLTIPSAAIGAYATKLFPSRSLAGFFGVALILVAVRMATATPGGGEGARRDQRRESRPRRPSAWELRLVSAEGKGFDFDYKANVSAGALLLFLEGFLSGLLGIGGGAVVVPTYVLVMGMPMHVAVATSMFGMVFTTAAGSVVHSLMGHVVAHRVLLLAAGGVIGGQIGARTAKRLRSSTLRRIFGALLAFVGVRMIVLAFLF